MRDIADKDIHGMLAQVEVPEPSPDLQERIITTAMASGHARQHQPVTVHQDAGFSGWWGKMRAEHGQKMAVAASVAILAIVVFDPAGHLTRHYLEQQQEAAVAHQQAQLQERYSVHGIPLLADISMMEEPDLDMEEVVSFNG